jgi:phosphatidylglycerol:prolipoprotein diacylglycerol transferase
VEELLLWSFPFALIGARAYHVVDLWDVYYKLFPSKIWAVWEGGLGIYGGIIGGTLGLFLFALWKLWKQGEVDGVKRGRLAFIGLRMLLAADLVAIAMPLGQAIGRLGNFVNKELFGAPTSLPWGVYIPQELRPEMYLGSEYFHPLFFYESGLNLILFALMIWLVFKLVAFRRGFFLAVYLVGYGVIRFGLDYLRIEPWRMGVFTVAQWISLLMIGVGCVMIIRNLDKLRFGKS